MATGLAKTCCDRRAWRWGRRSRCESGQSHLTSGASVAKRWQAVGVGPHGRSKKRYLVGVAFRLLLRSNHAHLRVHLPRLRSSVRSVRDRGSYACVPRLSECEPHEAVVQPRHGRCVGGPLGAGVADGRMRIGRVRLSHEHELTRLPRTVFYACAAPSTCSIVGQCEASRSCRIASRAPA
jgi:hypothetical protein